MEITVTADGIRTLQQQARAAVKAQRQAMHKAVDRATAEGQGKVRDAMRAAGLGRLSNAVRMTSSERKRRRSTDEAWGVIFAAGGDQSRAGGALESYSQGSTIRGRNVSWLAIATSALPKRMGRQRTTPKLYEEKGSPLGPLVFKRLSANRAILIAQGRFKVSVKTGRAKPFGGRATRRSMVKNDVVVFVLIRETKRAKRFDQRQIMKQASDRVPELIAEEMASALQGVPEKG